MEENVSTAIRFALDIALKATVLLTITAVALAALKRSSAAARQLVATLGLAGVLLLPVVTLIAPRWEIPLVPNPLPEAAAVSATRSADEEGTPRFDDETLSTSGDDSSMAARTAAPEPVSDVVTSVRPKAAETMSKPWRSPISTATGMLLILALWSAGLAFSLARFALGAARVRRVCRRASIDADGEWTALLAELSATVGLARPARLLFSEDLAVPVTTGVSRPVVLLPETARRWNEERRRVVLLHELAHVKRADWVALVIGQVSAALYWFHPLAWAIRIQMRKDCERACDDLVLAAGTRASVYAAHLLSILRSLRLSRQRALPTAVAMARRSYWDGRMRAILDPAVERRVVSPGHARLAAGTLFAAVVALAAFEPWSAREAEAVSSESSGVFAAVAAEGDGGDSCAGKSPTAKSAVTGEGELEPVPALAPEDAVPEVAPEDAAAPEAAELLVVAQAPEADLSPGYVKAGKRNRGDASWYERGMEFHNEERYDEAIDAFRRSIEEGERVEAATYNIACGYARKGDSARAFEWLQKAIDEGFEVDSYLAKDDDLDSLRPDPRFAELRRAARENKIEGSRAQADRIAARYERLKATPAARGKSFYEVGKDLLEVGRYDLAAQAFETAAARGHREGASLYNTACALSLKGDRARALDHLQKAIEAGFDDPGLIRKDEDLDNVRGEPRYRELLKIADDLELHRFQDFGGHKQWLRSSRQSAWREVEQHFVEYTQRHPESGRAWFNLGYARIEGDHAQEAIAAFQRALDLGYRKPTTMYNLACAHSILDRKDEAFGWLFKALDAGFDAHGTLRGDEDLDNLRGDPRFRQALARVKDLDHDD